MFSLDELFILAFGLIFGLLAFNQIVYPVFCVLTRFAEIQKVTKINSIPLFLAIMRVPFVWSILVVASFLVVGFYFPKLRDIYLGSLVMMLTIVVAQIPLRNRALEDAFIDLLKNLRGSIDSEPGQKAPETQGEEPQAAAGHTYPRYTVARMRMMEWKEADEIDVEDFAGLKWQCAECKEVETIRKELVHLQGQGRRFVVKCDACNKPSIIRVEGFLNTRVFTEARLPDYEKEGGGRDGIRGFGSGKNRL